MSEAERGFAFWIHVTPRARREEVGGRHGDALRVAVRKRVHVAGDPAALERRFEELAKLG